MYKKVVTINLWAILMLPFWIYCGVQLWGQPEFLLLVILAFKDFDISYTPNKGNEQDKNL